MTRPLHGAVLAALSPVRPAPCKLKEQEVPISAIGEDVLIKRDLREKADPQRVHRFRMWYGPRFSYRQGLFCGFMPDGTAVVNRRPLQDFDKLATLVRAPLRHKDKLILPGASVWVDIDALDLLGFMANLDGPTGRHICRFDGFLLDGTPLVNSQPLKPSDVITGPFESSEASQPGTHCSCHRSACSDPALVVNADAAEHDSLYPLTTSPKFPNRDVQLWTDGTYSLA